MYIRVCVFVYASFTQNKIHAVDIFYPDFIPIEA